MVLDAILPVVARCSSLALSLYHVAAASQEAARPLIDTAKVTNSFALNLKQVGTIITENDQLPSHVALESLEDIINQARSVLSAIENVVAIGHSHVDDKHAEEISSNRLSDSGIEYLSAHLEALRSTLSLLLQTLFTAQSIMWSRCRPTISPQQGAKTVRNERLQLESFIIDQQISMLCASRAYKGTSATDSRLLMESDSSLSLISATRNNEPSPANLYPYQDRHVAGLDTDRSSEASWLPAVSSIKSSQADRLLDRWTSLPQFEDRLREEERNARKEKHETQQPTVESDSDEDLDHGKLPGDGARRSHGRSGSVQPLFADPKGAEYYELATPLSSPAAARPSGGSLTSQPQEQPSPVTPRSSVGSLPVEAAAAIEAKEEDEDVDLQIPWTLCTRKYYWKYVDAKQVGSNTDENPSLAFLERHSWTEIMASWVCREAIQEAGFRFAQVQKDRKDGRRTKLETCFCIEKPLQFDQVQHLVERTVELYRRNAPPTPPPSNSRPSSYQRPPLPNPPKPNVVLDWTRPPVARNTHPPLDRANSNVARPPIHRSLSSMSGSEHPPPPYPPPKHQAGSNPRTSNLQIPMPPGQYAPQVLSQPQSPRPPQYPSQNTGYSSQNTGYPTQPTFPQTPTLAYPPAGPYSTSLPPHAQPHPFAIPQSPHRHSYTHPASSRYDDRDLATSESDSAGRDRARRHRSKSRSRHADRKRKSHKTSKAVGALMGVGGLTALLDQLSGL
ncbi:hypothetical protein ACN47E_002446 [Coniothyrium glycines]